MEAASKVGFLNLTCAMLCGEWEVGESCAPLSEAPLVQYCSELFNSCLLTGLGEDRDQR